MSQIGEPTPPNHRTLNGRRRRAEREQHIILSAIPVFTADAGQGVIRGRRGIEIRAPDKSTYGTGSKPCFFVAYCRGSFHLSCMNALISKSRQNLMERRRGHRVQTFKSADLIFGYFSQTVIDCLIIDADSDFSAHAVDFH